MVKSQSKLEKSHSWRFGPQRSETLVGLRIWGVGTDEKTYPGAEMQSDALVFKGTFTNTTLTEGSYVVTKNGVLSRISKDGMNIRPYRSYIYFNRQTAGAKAILLQNMNVNGFYNDEDHTTGI